MEISHLIWTGILLAIFYLVAKKSIKTYVDRSDRLDRTKHPISQSKLSENAKLEEKQPDPNDSENKKGSEKYLVKPTTILLTLEFDYLDSNNDYSHRIVEVSQYDLVTKMIAGFCRLRNAMRTFRMDRIKNAVHVESKESISDVFQYFQDLYAQSPQGVLDNSINVYKDAYKVLYYISKVDGKLTTKEKTEILAFVHEITGDNRIGIDHLNSTLAKMELPTKQSFKISCGKVNLYERNVVSCLINAIEKIRGLKKQLSPTELEAFNYIDLRLK